MGDSDGLFAIKDSSSSNDNLYGVGLFVLVLHVGLKVGNSVFKAFPWRVLDGGGDGDGVEDGALLTNIYSVSTVPSTTIRAINTLRYREYLCLK